MAKAKTHFTCQACGYQRRSGSGSARTAAAWSSLRGGGRGAGGRAAAGVGRLGRRGQAGAARGRRAARPRRAGARASPSSTGCWAAAWCPARWCCSAAIPASASPRCCWRRWTGSPRPGPVLYVSGEESLRQTKMRAERLGCRAHARCTSSRRRTRSRCWPRPRPSSPAALVVDSIQTMFLPELGSAPGSISPGARGRRAADGLRQALAGCPTFLVGHVTKDGSIAGPARARAHGGHRPLLRGRARPPVPHPARAQEPLRLHQRDRRLRDEGRGAGGGGGPVRAVPRRAAGGQAGLGGHRPRSTAPGRCWWRCRRWWRPRATAPRGARRSAWTATAWRCWPRCWRRRRTSSWWAATSSSTWRAGCSCPSRRATWRCARRWCRQPAEPAAGPAHAGAGRGGAGRRGARGGPGGAPAGRGGEDGLPARGAAQGAARAGWSREEVKVVGVETLGEALEALFPRLSLDRRRAPAGLLRFQGAITLPGPEWRAGFARRAHRSPRRASRRSARTAAPSRSSRQLGLVGSTSMPRRPAARTARSVRRRCASTWTIARGYRVVRQALRTSWTSTDLPSRSVRSSWTSGSSASRCSASSARS